LIAFTGVFPHDVPEEPPVWTHFGRVGTAQLDEWGGLGFYRVKRVKTYTFYDLRLLGIFIPNKTFASIRYKASRKFETLPRFYRFSITSLRHSSVSDLTIRYHYNQGFGAFLFDIPSTHLTTELALSFDMSDYLHDTQKTSYLKGGLFWDININFSSLALDFEYFHQISDIIPGKNEQTRYELSAELNIPIQKVYLFILGYEEEFYLSHNIQSVRSIYLSFGFKRLLSLIY